MTCVKARLEFFGIIQVFASTTKRTKAFLSWVDQSWREQSWKEEVQHGAFSFGCDVA